MAPPERHPLVDSKNRKALFSKVWLTLLRQEHVTPEAYRRILSLLHKKVMPLMTSPQLLLDFIVRILDSDDHVCATLALNSLFILIKEHNLVYPDFWKRLETLLSTQSMYLSHRSRFLRLLETFLQADFIASNYLESLLYRISRVSVFSPPAASLVLLGLTHHVLREHPSLQTLMHIDTTKYHHQETQEIIKKQLFSIPTLQEHIVPLVTRTAGIFKDPITKHVDLEEFLDITYHDLFEMYIKKQGQDAVKGAYKSGFDEDVFA